MATGAYPQTVSTHTSPQVKPRKAVSVKAVNRDEVLAFLSIAYLLLMLGFFCWLLFDTWIGAHTLPHALGYEPTRLNNIPTFGLVAFSVIGGALGATANGIRSFLIHRHGFAGRHVWKYITAPWMGSVLALLAYSLLHSSMAVLGSSATTIGGTQALANFAAGALAGYGSKDVLIWLDAQVEKLFKVPQPVPQVVGQTEAAATSSLHAHDLAVGEVSKVPQANDTKADIVTKQAPAANEIVARGDEVDIDVAAKPSNVQE